MRKTLNNRVFEIVFKTFEILFIILVILYLSIVIITKVTSNHSILGYRLINMNDHSMRKVYYKNDLLVVENSNDINIGDDVFYYGKSNGLEGRLIIHRVVKLDKDNVTTVGVDASLNDPEISKEEIQGKVKFKIPILSEINGIIKTQLGFFLLIFFPLVLILIIEILKTITEIKNGKKKVNPHFRPSYFKKQTKNKYIIPSNDKWYITYGGYTKKDSHSYDIYGQRWAYDFDMQVDGEYYHDAGDVNENYYGYGKDVIAPVDGFIVSISDGINDSRAYPDMRVSQDSKDVRGNYIIIKSEHGEYCTLCHLRKNSFEVGIGDIVRRGDKLAEVGNSGRTKGAHIHMQVNRGMDFNKSEPLVIRFENILVNGKKKNYIKVGDFVENKK